ncbi:MAG TPA: helix-turn-helix transcriptional regulator [Pricia antarctica]|uniref:Helix-turn-helix transcriptional regulator n=2 Tax=root TaxID=1 RepID=A0A831VLT3_9FLAO|nr:helix-turn-helix transcriptional regulator [Pricia antarctica]
MINTVPNLRKSPPPRNKNLRVAGTLPDDSDIEFIGIPSTKQCIWFQYGNQHSFATLPDNIFQLLADQFHSDYRAVLDIGEMTHDYDRQIELYTYYVYGDADFSPDVIDGVLQPAENFRDHLDCISLKWLTKDITLNGSPLNNRELLICDMMLENYTDKLMAHNLGIALATFDHHKRNLYKKAEVDNKSAFIIKLFNERI